MEGRLLFRDHRDDCGWMGKIPTYIWCVFVGLYRVCVGSGWVAKKREWRLEGGYYGTILCALSRASESYGRCYVIISLFPMHNSSFCTEPETEYGLMLLPLYWHMCNFPRYHFFIDSDDGNDKTFLWNALSGREMHNSKLGICS